MNTTAPYLCRIDNPVRLGRSGEVLSDVITTAKFSVFSNKSSTVFVFIILTTLKTTKQCKKVEQTILTNNARQLGLLSFLINDLINYENSLLAILGVDGNILWNERCYFTNRKASCNYELSGFRNFSVVYT